MKIENTSNPDPDKYKYSGGLGIGFDSKGQYTHPDGSYGKKCDNLWRRFKKFKTCNK